MVEVKDARVAELERTLKEIDKAVDQAMSEELIGARSLLSLRWARKLIARALGESDD